MKNFKLIQLAHFKLTEPIDCLSVFYVDKAHDLMKVILPDDQFLLNALCSIQLSKNDRPVVTLESEGNIYKGVILHSEWNCNFDDEDGDIVLKLVVCEAPPCEHASDDVVINIANKTNYEEFIKELDKLGVKYSVYQHPCAKPGCAQIIYSVCISAIDAPEIPNLN